MESVRKIKTLDNALLAFEQSAIEHGEATKEGDFKVANKAYDSLIKAVAFIRDNDNDFALSRFLEHEEISLRVAAATFLLRDNNQDAVKVLEEIQSSPRFFCY